VTLPFIQCHHVCGRASAGGERNASGDKVDAIRTFTQIAATRNNDNLFTPFTPSLDQNCVLSMFEGRTAPLAVRLFGETHPTAHARQAPRVLPPAQPAIRSMKA
jgi:hypothetical protein